MKVGDLILCTVTCKDVCPNTPGKIVRVISQEYGLPPFTYKVHFYHPDNLYKDNIEIHTFSEHDLEFCRKISYKELPEYVKNYLMGHSNRGM